MGAEGSLSFSRLLRGLSGVFEGSLRLSRFCNVLLCFVRLCKVLGSRRFA